MSYTLRVFLQNLNQLAIFKLPQFIKNSHRQTVFINPGFVSGCVKMVASKQTLLGEKRPPRLHIIRLFLSKSEEKFLYNDFFIGKFFKRIFAFRNENLSYVRRVTHRVISDRVNRLLVTLSYFRPDRVVQLFSLIPILILLLYLLVSARLNRSRVYWLIAIAEVLLERQLISKLNSNLSGAEITSNFSTYK